MSAYVRQLPAEVNLGLLAGKHDYLQCDSPIVGLRITNNTPSTIWWEAGGTVVVTDTPIGPGDTKTIELTDEYTIAIVALQTGSALVELSADPFVAYNVTLDAPVAVEGTLPVSLLGNQPVAVNEFGESPPVLDTGVVTTEGPILGTPSLTRRNLYGPYNVADWKAIAVTFYALHAAHSITLSWYSTQAIANSFMVAQQTMEPQPATAAALGRRRMNVEESSTLNNNGINKVFQHLGPWLVVHVQGIFGTTTGTPPDHKLVLFNNSGETQQWIDRVLSYNSSLPRTSLVHEAMVCFSGAVNETLWFTYPGRARFYVRSPAAMTGAWEARIECRDPMIDLTWRSVARFQATGDAQVQNEVILPPTSTRCIIEHAAGANRTFVIALIPEFP